MIFKMVTWLSCYCSINLSDDIDFSRDFFSLPAVELYWVEYFRRNNVKTRLAVK